jgi:hypothetical protein
LFERLFRRCARKGRFLLAISRLAVRDWLFANEKVIVIDAGSDQHTQDRRDFS